MGTIAFEFTPTTEPAVQVAFKTAYMNAFSHEQKRLLDGGVSFGDAETRALKWATDIMRIVHPEWRDIYRVTLAQP